MKRRRWLTAGATAVMLLLAASATATSNTRSAKSVLVFGVRNDAVGFNTALACCNSLEAGFMGAIESGRGAFLTTSNAILLERW